MSVKTVNKTIVCIICYCSIYVLIINIVLNHNDRNTYIVVNIYSFISFDMAFKLENNYRFLKQKLSNDIIYHVRIYKI